MTSERSKSDDAAVRKAIRALSPSNFAIFCLYYVEKKSPEWIADQLPITESEVRKRLRKARRILGEHTETSVRKCLSAVSIPLRELTGLEITNSPDYLSRS